MCGSMPDAPSFRRVTREEQIENWTMTKDDHNLTCNLSHPPPIWSQAHTVVLPPQHPNQQRRSQSSIDVITGSILTHPFHSRGSRMKVHEPEQDDDPTTQTMEHYDHQFQLRVRAEWVCYALTSIPPSKIVSPSNVRHGLFPIPVCVILRWWGCVPHALNANTLGSIGHSIPAHSTRSAGSITRDEDQQA